MNPQIPGSAAELLAELDALGIHVEADGDRLRFEPREKMTDELVSRMKLHKAELLRLINHRQYWDLRISAQVAALVPYRTPDGRDVLVNPSWRPELERLGLL